VKELREESVKFNDDAGVIMFTRMFLESARHLDLLEIGSLSRKEKNEAAGLKGERDKLGASLEVLFSGRKCAKRPSGPIVSHVPFAVPDGLTGFGKTLSMLNRELAEIHSDHKIRREAKIALDVLAGSLNSQMSSDATETEKLHSSKQYIASLRLSDCYEKTARRMLWCARAGDLPEMVEVGDDLGVNLQKLLYSRGIYLKFSKGPQRKL